MRHQFHWGRILSFVTGLVDQDCQWREKRALVATRIRQLGLSRILYGSDGREYPARAVDSISAIAADRCRVRRN
jgi:hypothetical protein